MKNNYKILMESALFLGIKPENFRDTLQCLGVYEKSYEKNSIILHAGTQVSSIGIMSEGNAQIIREDAEGNRAILSDLAAADMFAEAYAAAGRAEIPISVVSTSFCRVFWIPYNKIVSPCSYSCEHHRSLIENLMKIIAQKNILMNEKMRLISCKTTKEKLLTYLHDYSEKTGKNKFSIPFSRNELADFLNADRSAMSRELGKLRDEGLIRFNRNEFEILRQK